MPHPETPARLADSPTAYFLTFSCYGTRLHGDTRGSVDRFFNGPGTPVLPPNGRRERFEGRLLKGPPVTLDASQRNLVLEAILRHCEVREWILHAAHVRTNHVHVVLWAGIQPERALVEFKGYASRALNRDAGGQRRWWANHGSTRYLWDARQIAAAVDYVAHEQGALMALYLNWETSI